MEGTAVNPAQHDGSERRLIGDRHDLAELMQFHGKMIYALALRLVRNEAVAQDLTQEVFLHALERSNQYDATQGTVSQWLAGIARNLALDHLKSADERRRDPHAMPEQMGRSSLEEELVESDQWRMVKSAVQDLNETQQEVIRLAYYEGLSHSDIATRLREPLGTVKGRMRAAIRRLRFVLVEEM